MILKSLCLPTLIRLPGLKNSEQWCCNSKCFKCKTGLPSSQWWIWSLGTFLEFLSTNWVEAGLDLLKGEKFLTVNISCPWLLHPFLLLCSYLEVKPKISSPLVWTIGKKKYIFPQIFGDIVDYSVNFVRYMVVGTRRLCIISSTKHFCLPSKFFSCWVVLCSFFLRSNLVSEEWLI